MILKILWLGVASFRALAKVGGAHVHFWLNDEFYGDPH